MNISNWNEIFKALPVACLVLKPNPNGGLFVIDVNEPYLVLTGTITEDLVGKDAKEIIPYNTKENLEDNSPIQQSFQLVLDTAKPHALTSGGYDISIRGIETCGDRQWEIKNIPLLNEKGELEVILHTIKDNTLEFSFEKREKELKMEIAVNRQQYRNFIRSNPDGLFRLDLQGNFLHANEGLAKMADIPLEQILKMDFLPFCAPNDKEYIFSQFVQASKGHTLSFEADFISAKGNLLILKILLMPMVIDGKIAEVHGIAKDISGIRESEKVIIEKSRFLEVNAAFISSLMENELNEDALHKTFEIIGRTVEADRMYYFGADRDPETNEILISQKVEWCSEKATAQLNNPEMQNMPIKKIEEIISPLTKNQPFNATLSKLSDGMMKEIFTDQDIKSMLLLPIFMEDDLYGFIGFDDCTREREWNQDEITFLRSLTNNLTNAFEKREALLKVKKREEDLKRSEQKFRSLVQEGSDLITILDPKGNHFFVSENHKNILGIAPAELTGKNASEFIHPEDWERVREQFLELHEVKQVKISPFRFRNKQGEYRWLQTTATNMMQDSSVQGIVSNSRDITTIIEQAREIENINERYQLAATATEDLLYDWDLQTREVNRFHRGLKKLFGYTSEEVNQRDFWKTKVHPEDFPNEKKKLSVVLNDPSQSFIKTEYRFRRADGSYAKVSDKGYILRDHSGKAIRLIGATSDISDITAKKEALKIANQRFQMAMKATNEMIWDWEIATDSVTRNKGYKEIFGYDTNQATSVHSFWLTKVFPKDQHRIRTSLKEILSDPTQEKWELEYRLIKANGELAFVHDRGYILRDENGTATRMVGAVLDVTKFRTLIGKIKKQNSVLKDIAWEQSHSVRAPLARIKGLLNLLENDDHEAMSREQVLYHIRESAEELDGIIRSIVGKTEEMEAHA
ncbi:PAS domain-containing protein [Salinimicrobium gaetbulicola]|uniref:histidine kinase n=1 Tax=Salinimicrobium gaetbulicola TaxID=999702 RepID=A0ABW3IKL6_9FLAO